MSKVLRSTQITALARLLIILFVIITPLLSYLTINFIYDGKIIPRVIVSGVEVSGFNKNQFINSVSLKINAPNDLVLKEGNSEYNISLEKISFKYDYGLTFESAYKIYREQNFFQNLYNIILSVFKPQQLDLLYSYDGNALEEYLSVISSKISIDPIYPTVQINGDDVIVSKGSAGKEVDIKNLRNDIDMAFRQGSFGPISITVNIIDPTLSNDQEQALIDRAKKLIGKSITFVYEDKLIKLEGQEILNLISPYDKYNKDAISEVVNSLIKEVERPPQNSIFTLKDGKVVEFVPSKEGLSIKGQELSDKIEGALSNIEQGSKEEKVEIPVTIITPEITNNEANKLGINELLGRGESFFKGSIPARVHNISLASSKINGSLIAPGEIFSFNSTVGDVSALTGYRQAYIIQDGKTILGDGGGVCQVSTTLFRAVLNSGLPIVERSPHSYRVSYYEQGFPPGLDATVFSPTTDFKFKNDTPANILIQTIFDSKNSKLTIELYGTKDGRIAEISKPTITRTVAPPDDLYIDDPTLPVGTIKQIDYKAWGARVEFNYKVTRNGETIQQTRFVSNYKPWQAKFLRGTAPN